MDKIHRTCRTDLLLMGFFILGTSSICRAETLELVTYYPASSNAGNLHAASLTVGTAYDKTTPADGTAIIVGPVGIGTAAPAERLDVAGDLIVRNPITPTNRVHIRVGSDANTGIELRGENTSPTGTPYIDFSSQAKVDYDARIRLTGAGRLNIEGAKLGIDIAAPDKALHVKGQIRVDDDDPQIILREMDQPTDFKQWKLIADKGKFRGGSVNDADTEFFSWVEVERDPLNNRIKAVYFPGQPSFPHLTGGGGQFVIGRNNTDGYSGKFHVEGGAHKSDNGEFWDRESDARLKKDIRPLEGALEKMLQLRGVWFTWKDPKRGRSTPGPQMGMIGQEVEKVFPDWVTIESNGMRSLSPIGLDALTIEAIRELQQQNEQLRAQLEAQEKELQLLKKQVEKTDRAISSGR